MLKWRGLVMIFLVAFGFEAFAQGKEIEVVRKYTISLAGIDIGEMQATRIQRDSITRYRLVSKVSFWLFVRVNVEHTIVSEYHHDVLVSTISTSKSNRGNFQSTVIKNHDHYVVKASSHKYQLDTVIRKPIKYNVVRLYFEKPTGITEILADTYGILAPAHFAEKDMLVTNVLGNKNKFYFRSNDLLRAVMYSTVKNYEIRRTEEALTSAK
jgi:hypothetical protein